MGCRALLEIPGGIEQQKSNLQSDLGEFFGGNAPIHGTGLHLSLDSYAFVWRF